MSRNHVHKSAALVLVVSGMLWACGSGHALAWHMLGHRQIAVTAARSLPEDMPAFFREGAMQIGHCANDPDVFKVREVSALSSEESPEHYLDLELVENVDLPLKRFEFYRMCLKKQIEPTTVGTLPYAMLEGVERLAVAFAEYRKWPDNPYIRAKCLVYAGNLAHYSGDLCQPLHTTIHHDGRADKDGKSPRSGIHMRVDALLEKVALSPVPAGEITSLPTADERELLKAMMAEVTRSNALVDKTYELESEFPAADQLITSERVSAFALERGRAATVWTARLYLTAWKLSERIELPTWIERDDGPSIAPKGQTADVP